MEQTVGSVLRELRGDRSMEEVAGSLNITRTALFNYENDRRIPRDEIKVRIANYFGRSVQEIFFAHMGDNS